MLSHTRGPAGTGLGVMWDLHPLKPLLVPCTGHLRGGALWARVQHSFQSTFLAVRPGCPAQCTAPELVRSVTLASIPGPRSPLLARGSLSRYTARRVGCHALLGPPHPVMCGGGCKVGPEFPLGTRPPCSRGPAWARRVASLATEAHSFLDTQAHFVILLRPSRRGLVRGESRGPDYALGPPAAVVTGQRVVVAAAVRRLPGVQLVGGMGGRKYPSRYRRRLGGEGVCFRVSSWPSHSAA